MNTTTVEYGFFDQFFTTVGVFTTAVAITFALVAQLAELHDNDNDEEDDIPFCQEYYDEFHNMEEKEFSDEEKKALTTTFTHVESPDGKVILCYNSEREAFSYWTDAKNISFMDLDACAHKYAIENDCKIYVIDYKVEYEKALSKIKNEYEGAQADSDDNDNDKDEDEDDAKNTTEESKDDVFATFKKYNTVKGKVKGIDSKPHILPDKCNQFRREGSIKDWTNKYDNERTDEDSKDDKKNLTWADYQANKSDNVVLETDEDKKEK